jgi:hypothetical protein|tara:strand:+ start:211 stop:414 length:204 start_codon:yes stop_codon:yes gene_type:complete
MNIESLLGNMTEEEVAEALAYLWDNATEDQRLHLMSEHIAREGTTDAVYELYASAIEASNNEAGHAS